MLLFLKRRMDMKIYMAPMEGITGYIFRKNICKYFGGIDKYFTPFISPCEKGVLGKKVLREILPENNKGQYLVPQILTNSAEGFITMCKSLEQYGYREFNLNLGCPSGTVVSKGRGSGFLAYPDELDRFLNDIFKSGYRISVKTRLGKNDPEEFYRLLDIYNKYPIYELIIHPRTRGDMYKNRPDTDMYGYAVRNSKNPICYNGDIFDMEYYNGFIEGFPNTDMIMIGRGLLIDPGLALEIKNGGSISKQTLRSFYNSIYEDYSHILSGSTPLMYKMKELLTYMVFSFEDPERISKKIKKSKTIAEFDDRVNELFGSYELKK